MRVLVAEKRGETRMIKELLKEEETTIGNAVMNMENQIDRMKRENELKRQKNYCIRQFIDNMLFIFETEG